MEGEEEEGRRVEKEGKKKGQGEEEEIKRRKKRGKSQARRGKQKRE